MFGCSIGAYLTFVLEPSGLVVVALVDQSSSLLFGGDIRKEDDDEDIGLFCATNADVVVVPTATMDKVEEAKVEIFILVFYFRCC